MTTATQQRKLMALKRFVSPVAGSLVVVAILISARGSLNREASPVETAQVQTTFDRFPEELRSDAALWLQSRLVPVPTGQAKLLGDSAFVSREYLRLRSFPQITAILFLVYCADAQMMAGHHPPNCYPSSGWNLGDSMTDVLSVHRPDGRNIEATIYYFRHARQRDRELAIVSGFFVSGEGSFATLDEANRHAGPSLLGGNGLFQFQILLQGAITPADVRQYGSEILLGIPSEIFDDVIGTKETSGFASDPGDLS